MLLYDLIGKPGEVFEIRGIGLRGYNSAWQGFASGKAGIVSGYFNDPEKFTAAANALDAAKARGVYYTANPCEPALLSRAFNRLICPSDGETTADQYIAYIRWFLVDLDAKLIDGGLRPKGVSASDEELVACQVKAAAVAAYLEETIGFAKGIRGFSGNGYHLLYRLPDLPNDDEHKMLIKQVMAALAGHYDPDDIDTSVINPARIWKFYGTTARKGDSTPERPHRQSYIYPNQPQVLAEVPVTPIDVLKEMVGRAGAEWTGGPGRLPGNRTTIDLPRPVTRRMTSKELGQLDMEKYLQAFGIEHNVKEDGNKTMYRLEKCLFNADHGRNEAAIIVSKDSGKIIYHCKHNSCRSHTWKNARQQISGDRKLAEFCTGYDPNWTPRKVGGMGIVDALPYPMTDAAALQNGIGAEVAIPAPVDIDPMEFYQQKGRRPVFVPMRLARYVAAYLHPLCHNKGIFYHYEHGVWATIEKDDMVQIIVHALKDECQAGWIDAQLKILAGLVNRSDKEWPDNIMIINVKNGMLDLGAKELLPHDPKYGSRVQLPVHYDPEAWSERWDTFLKDIFFDDDRTWSKRLLLQQYFGYCLLRDSRYQKALFMYGTGANGKSTVLDVLTAMVGEENVSSLSLHDLREKFRTQFLQNKLVNLSTETDTRDTVASHSFKQVVDNSLVMTEKKYGEAYQYRPYAKWIIAMNDTPNIPDKSHGFERRVLVLQFNRRFELHEIKRNYADYLIEEIDGVFNWAVEGLFALLRLGDFTVGEQVKEDTANMMEVLDPLLVFVSECCEVHGDLEVNTVRLWHAYRAWCTDGGNRPLGRNKFLGYILTKFTSVKRIRPVRDGVQQVLFHGIALVGAGLEYAEKGKQRAARKFDSDDD